MKDLTGSKTLGGKDPILKIRDPGRIAKEKRTQALAVLQVIQSFLSKDSKPLGSWLWPSLKTERAGPCVPQVRASHLQVSKVPYWEKCFPEEPSYGWSKKCKDRICEQDTLHGLRGMNMPQGPLIYRYLHFTFCKHLQKNIDSVALQRNQIRCFPAENLQSEWSKGKPPSLHVLFVSTYQSSLPFLQSITLPSPSATLDLKAVQRVHKTF